MIVIADTSVLIALGAAERLDLLHKLWKVVFVPQRVLAEISVGRPGYSEVVKAVENGWLKVCPFSEEDTFLPLDPTSGEAHCLLLAQKMEADLTLIDDLFARKVAVSAGFKISGSVGVIMLSLRRNLLSVKEVYEILDAWRIIGFRLSKKLVQMILDEASR
ncbi:MAG: hypothetical protein K6U04_00350 [Armatimonadetes bacterium]|nr:hypothetical protein [Armatimonadota bacterium]